MRPMTVDGFSPVRNAAIAVMNVSAFWPLIFGTGVSAAGLVAWQPVQAAAPPGGSGEAASAALAYDANTAAAKVDRAFMLRPPIYRETAALRAAVRFLTSGDLQIVVL